MRAFSASFALLGLSLAFWSPARAEDAAIQVAAKAEPAALFAGESGKLALEIEIPAGWHLWALDPGEGPTPLRIQSPTAAGFELDGPWFGRAPTAVFDRGFGRELAQYQGQVRLERRLVVLPGAEPTRLMVPIEVTGQICTDRLCVAQRVRADLSLTITNKPTGSAAPLFSQPALAEAVTEAVAVTQRASAKLDPVSPQPSGRPARGIFSFLLLAFLAGLGALATPCVFPAIPLTVSFFSKFSEESLARGARLAAFYALSMMCCFTLAGVMVSALIGATGVQQFAAHPVFNLVLALVLVVFSLNLMGMFEIRTPAFLLDFTNRLEGRYGPQAKRRESGLSDYIAVGVAAMTSTTVFFTCTVAFVGVVLVGAAQGEWFWPTIGMLAFSFAFVLPFFLLALFPQVARRLRGRHGAWLNITRTTLGFIELAAAAKFFSNADLVLGTNWLARDLVLTFWIALFSALGLHLFGKLELATEAPAEVGSPRITIPRMLFGVGVFAFSLYLAAALFGGRPLGGWVDGWLPPAVMPGTEMTAGAKSDRDERALAYLHDLASARRLAKENGTLVFVNYTGFACTNCRYMESGVFTLPKISARLRQMTLVELYTDGRGEVYQKNREDQIARYGTAALPLYAVETADGRSIAHFPSSTNDPAEFERFLAGAQKKALADSQARVRREGEGTDTGSSDAPLRLLTRRLAGGQSDPAIVPKKWSLVSFWATWCAPCRVEIREFMAKLGADLESQGGRFALVALEPEEMADKANAFMLEAKVAATSALRLSPSSFESEVDPRLGFSGDTLPYTLLVSPEGKVVWKHSGSLTEPALRAVLTEHLGFAGR